MKQWICFFSSLLLACQAVTAGNALGSGKAFYGPEKFVCCRWIYPDVHTRTFHVSTPGKGILTIRNGGKYGFPRVAVAEIFLNGAKIFGIEEFLKAFQDMEAQVALGPANVLTVKIYSYPGSYLTVSISGEDQGLVEILSPLDGAVVIAKRTAVIGAVYGMTDPFGVSVNGIPALVWEGRFAVTGIPLQEGENTLTAVAMEGGGRTVSASCTVQVPPGSEGISLCATAESGISPLETTLSIEAPFSFDAATLDHEGPGEVEILESRPGKFRIRITGAGLYSFSAEVMKDDRSFRDTLHILVMGKEDLDGILRKTWEDMKTALIRGDHAGALHYFHEDTRELYGEIFEGLGDDLPRITMEMRDIAFVSMEDNMARYRIRKDRMYAGKPLTVTHDVYFARDRYGLWKVYRY